MHQFSIQAGSKATDPADVWVYGDIGGGWFGDGITAKEVAKELKAVKSASALNVHINSYGGDVFDGIAIMNLLKGHGAQVNVQVDGIAASAASVVAMAGETITVHSGGQIMVHNPWSISIGDANAMRADADRLDKVGAELVAIYSERTGNDSATVKAFMDDETWFNAKEAKANGFATEVVEKAAIAACGGDWARDRFPRWFDASRSAASDTKPVRSVSAMEMQMHLTRNKK